MREREEETDRKELRESEREGKAKQVEGDIPAE